MALAATMGAVGVFIVVVWFIGVCRCGGLAWTLLLLLLLLDLGAWNAVGCEEGDEFLFGEGEAERSESDS